MFWVLTIRHCSKCFIWINSLIPHNSLINYILYPFHRWKLWAIAWWLTWPGPHRWHVSYSVLEQWSMSAQPTVLQPKSPRLPPPPGVLASSGSRMDRGGGKQVTGLQKTPRVLTLRGWMPSPGELERSVSRAPFPGLVALNQGHKSPGAANGDVHLGWLDAEL